MMMNISYLDVQLKRACSRGFLHPFFVVSLWFIRQTPFAYSLLFLSVLLFAFCSQSHVSCLSRVDSHRFMEKLDEPFPDLCLVISNLEPY